MENKPEENADLGSLEEPATTVSAASSNAPAPRKQPFGKRIRGLISHVNIYLLLFIFILVLAGMIVVVGMQRTKKELATPTINTAELTPEALEELNQSESKVGDPKQTLTVESNAIFSGKVLIRDSLDVAGTIKVGGALSLPGITVSGTSAFDQITANKLSIAGDTTIQGTLNVQRNITAAGATFGGPISAPQINTTTLQLTGDLNITRHIDAGGGTPGISNGTALGGGGTASISGTDTAGTVTLNTGGSPPAGCFATVNFAQRFSGTPHVSITPVGSAAGGLNFYVTRNTTSFTICTTNPAPAGQNFSFDYIVID